MTRVCFAPQVDPALLNGYRAQPAAVWPELLRALAPSCRRGYRLFRRSDGRLVGTLDTDEQGRPQAADTAGNGRWQAAMARFFGLLDRTSADEAFVVLEEIVHLDVRFDAARAGAADDQLGQDTAGAI